MVQKKNPIWLSILVPVYNVKDYLQECFASIFSQIGDGVEIIVIDDQSTDGSFALLQDLKRNTELNFNLLQNETNQGISVVRNNLLREAKGDYIWFIDSDDVLVQGAVKQLVDIVNTHAPDLVMCDYEIWHSDKTNQAKNSVPNEHVHSFAGPICKLTADPMVLFAGLYQCGKLHCWSKIFKRELWDETLQFPRGKYFEDMAVAPRLALKVNTFYYVPEAWIWYRKRAGSILAVPSKKKIDDMVAGLDDVLELWLKKYPNMPFSARMMFIRYAVKVYFFTLKELKKIEQDDNETIEHFRALLFKHIGCNKFKLVIYYVRDGDFFRLPKLLRYV